MECGAFGNGNGCENFWRLGAFLGQIGKIMGSLFLSIKMTNSEYLQILYTSVLYFFSLIVRSPDKDILIYYHSFYLFPEKCCYHIDIAPRKRLVSNFRSIGVLHTSCAFSDLE